MLARGEDVKISPLVWAGALCVGTVGLVASRSSGASITPASGVGADTFVQNGSTNNNSAGTDLVVKFTGNDADTTNRKAYVRFDTSQFPAPGTIGSASLSLTVSSNNG